MAKHPNPSDKPHPAPAAPAPAKAPDPAKAPPKKPSVKLPPPRPPMGGKGQDPVQLDSLTPQQINQIKYRASNAFTAHPPSLKPVRPGTRQPAPSKPGAATRAGAPAPADLFFAPSGPLLVAEGDSWFNYDPFTLDILDNLSHRNGYTVYRMATPGDSLENMIYGLRYDSSWHRQTPQLDELVQAVTERNPKAVLFSGGGNDIAGTEFVSFLNHRSSGLPDMRDQYAQFVISRNFRVMYQTMIDRILAAKPDIHIFSHGYGYPIPDGRGWGALGMSWIGPWLRPGLTSKDIPIEPDGREIMHRLIDMFNEMLAEVQEKNPNFHYLDVRGIITDSDWVNELHVKSSCYARIADVFDAAIKKHAMV